MIDRATKVKILIEVRHVLVKIGGWFLGKSADVDDMVKKEFADWEKELQAKRTSFPINEN